MNSDMAVRVQATGALSVGAMLQDQAERTRAKTLAERMEEHFKRFGTEENGFNVPNSEELTMAVLQRAARSFWQKHPKLWPMFRVSGTGCSIEFRRIR